MESRKTTTITFRIDDSLKQKLSQVAERENKTITVKAKEALTEYLEINPVRGMVKETNLEVYKLDLDIDSKLKKWKGAFDTEYLGILENQKLLNEYHSKIKQLTNDIEKIKNNGIGFKLTYFAIAIIFFNFLLTGLLFFILGN